MKICYIVDARSPIARNWIAYFVNRDDVVHVISSSQCPTETIPGASLHVVPLAFSGLDPPKRGDGTATGAPRLSLGATLRSHLRGGQLSPAAFALRWWLAPLEMRRRVTMARSLIAQIQPDLIHAMRIPMEGILAAEVAARYPLLVSVWGNDFTLFARRFPWLRQLTRRTMRRADGLHTDCARDLRLARAHDLAATTPSIVLPGAGGIQTSIFLPGPPDQSTRMTLGISEDADVVINPRGFRNYVRNDTFFRAIPLVLRRRPRAVFLAPSMEGNALAERWIYHLGVRPAVRLLPPVSRERMADLFRIAAVSVSPSAHDGTPNTLLEAMACGCFPVAGDIDSVREWLDDGVNGLLCDPADPESLAAAILRGLADGPLRRRAAAHNACLIAERAEYGRVMARALGFYEQVIELTAGAGARSGR